MPELFANAAQSTLANSIGPDSTTITVASASAFPTAGNFRVVVGTEIMLVTAVSGTTFTVSRGQEGTSASSHGAGTGVALELTAGSLDQRLIDSIGTGSYGSRPSASKAGQLYLPNDGFALGRDTGSAWHEWGPLFPFTPPVDGDFAWVNQGGASVSTTKGGILLTAPGGAACNLRIRKKSAPSRPYTITAFFKVIGYPSDIWSAGLCWRQSSDGRVATFEVGYRAAWVGFYNTVAKYTDATTFSASYFTPDINVPRAREWPSRNLFLRIREDSSARFADVSHDGQNFRGVHSVGRTDFMTADEVGFYANAANNQDVKLLLLSWKQE